MMCYVARYRPASVSSKIVFRPVGPGFMFMYNASLAGPRADGSSKIRPIDDMRKSKVNAATSASEKLKCDTIDSLMDATRAIAVATQCEIDSFKADIDSEHRRVPSVVGERDLS